MQQLCLKKKKKKKKKILLVPHTCDLPTENGKMRERKREREKGRGKMKEDQQQRLIKTDFGGDHVGGEG